MLRSQRVVSWVMLIVGIVGFLVTVPMFLLDMYTERMMLLITLVLSWAALWYSAFISIQVSNKRKREENGG